MPSEGGDPNNGHVDLADAEEVTAALGQVLSGAVETIDGGLRLIADGIKRGVPKALGKSNAEWADGLLPQRRLPSILQRRELVAELAEEGLSQREIAAAVGVSEATVNRDLNSGVTNATANGEDIDDDADFPVRGVTDVTEGASAQFAIVDRETGEIVGSWDGDHEGGGAEPAPETPAPVEIGPAPAEPDPVAVELAEYVAADDEVRQARIRGAVARCVSQVSGGLLLLKPESVRGAIDDQQRRDLGYLQAKLTSWFRETLKDDGAARVRRIK